MIDLFLDTDVAFDFISGREPFGTHSKKILLLHNSQEVSFSISSCSILNLIYLSSQTYKLINWENKLNAFLRSCLWLDTSKETFFKAMLSPIKDKEDAVQYFTALEGEFDYFLTRNKKDYQSISHSIEVISPTEFLELRGKA
ncbi:type II toxin-antitoxin system VapC family toxin [Algoriphagus sp.]|uniref:type II toxin-antitoxin system VapC family toxin n=1 Tax=Algoriphagus sp. TaxID=1872435 RepID=UPI003919EAF9